MPAPSFGQPARTAATAPVLASSKFFSGRTEGDGQLKIMFGRRHHVAVHGMGRIRPDGMLVLDQIVEEAGKPAKARHWRIAEVAPGHYAGSMSEAEGPVEGVVEGNRLRLHFAMPGGLRAEQEMTLAANGQSAANRMTVRKFGMVVATLDETIRRVDSR